MNQVMPIEDAEFEEVPPQYEEVSDETLVQICMDAADNSIYGIDGADVTTPLDYYYGRQPALVACKDPKASTVVSLDVRDTVEATVAEIIPAFSGSDIARFEASDQMDEEQAKIESDICNYLFMEKYNGLSVLTAALKDCLLFRNCYAKVFWDRRYEVGYESFDQVPETAVQQLMQPRVEGEEVEVIDHEEVEPPQELMQQFQQMQQQHQQAMVQAQQAAAMGQPVQMPQPPQLPAFFNISLRRKTIKSEPVIESIPVENALIDGSLEQVDLTAAVFSCHRTYPTRSELIERNYDPEVVQELPEYSGTRAGGVTTSNASTLAKQTEVIEVYECWVRVDRDQDGIAEMRRVVISDERLLDDAPWDETDMVAGATCAMPHKHEGVSMFDVMYDIQATKTDLLRTILDGAALAARQRLEATEDVNFDDLLTATRGGVVRSKRIGSVAPLPNPEIPPTVYSSMEMMDKIRRERGGSAVDSAQQTMQISGDTAHGIERVMSNIELTNAMSARTFADTFVRGIYLRMHELIRKFNQGEISARIDGQWVSSDPSHWPQRDRVSINVGASQGERQRMAAALQGIQANQKEMLEKGMTIVTPDKLYESSVDIANYLGVNNPEQYYVDPQSEEGQQLQQQMQQQQQEAQSKMQQDEMFQKQLAAAQSQAQTQLAQAEMAKAQVQSQNNQLKHQIDMLKQQLEQAEAGAKVQLETEQMNRDTAIDLLKLEQEQNKQLDKEYQQNKGSA